MRIASTLLVSWLVFGGAGCAHQPPPKTEHSAGHKAQDPDDVDPDEDDSIELARARHAPAARSVASRTHSVVR
jgi:hypothetical protein